MSKRKVPKPKCSGTHRKNFIKLLEQTARTTSTWNVFNDFIALSALSISNSSDTYHIANSEEVWNKREQRYLDIINQYNQNTRSLFPQMFNELVSELQDAATSHYTDVLGELFGELGFHDKWRGQFFTPQHISDLMALTTISSDITANAIKERGFFTICEPCCGAGSLIIGAINAMREMNINHSKQLLVVANDIDERCVLMCYIQLSLYGVPAIVLQQNTLSEQTYGSPWFTPVFVFDGWTWKAQRALSQDPKDTNPESTQSATEAVDVEPITEDETSTLGQLSLF